MKIMHGTQHVGDTELSLNALPKAGDIVCVDGTYWSVRCIVWRENVNKDLRPTEMLVMLLTFPESLKQTQQTQAMLDPATAAALKNNS